MLLPELLPETLGPGRQDDSNVSRPAETAPAPNAGAAGPSAGLFKKTMLGISPGALRELEPPLAGTSPSTDSPVPATPVGQETMSPAQPAPAPFQTMLGMAPLAPTKAPINEAKQTLMGAGTFAKPEAKQLLPVGNQKGTLIGVAIPGIAPINPGVDKTPIEGSAEEKPQVVEPIAEPLTPAINVAQPATQTTRRYLALSLAISAGFLAVVSAIAIWWWRSTPRLAVAVRTDESGRDSLELDCPNCSDDSAIALAETSIAFRSHHATIPLKAPLKMGDNSVELLLSRRGTRPEKIQLSVPVEYRVAGDTAGLDETPPRLRVLFEKLPNVAIAVDQQPVSFDSSGRGRFDIDVSNDLVGPSSVERPLERRISYSVRSASGTTQGSVNIRTGILPLNIDSPGPLLVTDQQEFKLCGTTAPGAHIDVAGLNVTVNGSGHFCHPMLIKEAGKFTIWITSSAKGFAPRRIPRVIERISNLAEYAKKLYSEVPHELDKSVPAAGTSGNSMIAVSGTIMELSEAPPITRLLVQLGSKRDAQGFVRVVASNQPALPAGHIVTVFGQVTGTLKGPDGRDMRELSAAFVVSGVP
jgi:hypothetical protein